MGRVLFPPPAIMGPLLLALLLMLAAEPARAAVQWKRCQESSGTPDALYVSKVTISPDPAQRAQPMTLRITGVARVDIPTTSTLRVAVYLLGVRVYTTSGPLCDAVQLLGPSLRREGACPIPVSTAFAVEHAEALPSVAPPSSHYSMRMSVTAPTDTEDEAAAGPDEELMCVDVWFSVAHAAPAPQVEADARGSGDSSHALQVLPLPPPAWSGGRRDVPVRQGRRGSGRTAGDENDLSLVLV